MRGTSARMAREGRAASYFSQHICAWPRYLALTGCFLPSTPHGKVNRCFMVRRRRPVAQENRQKPISSSPRCSPTGFTGIFAPRPCGLQQARPEARCLAPRVPGAARSVLPSSSTGPQARLLPALSQGVCISPQHSLCAPEDPPCSA